MVEKSTELANKQAKLNKSEVASLILEPIDYTVLKTIEEYVGPLITKTAEKNYQETIVKTSKK